MNKSIYRIGFFILLVVNIALLVLFYFGPKRPPQRLQPNQAGIKDQLAMDLGFSEEQKARFDKMAMDHRDKVSRLENRERNLMDAYFDQLTKEDSEAEREQLLDEIQAINREKIEFTYSHFVELRGICTEEQLGKFDDALARILPALTNSGPGGPPPGNPPR
ncbi:hypothetical protein GCM10009119_01630 [Algoriphagus jejuensis]|uniref:Heavy-metal resistance protein n=1 Tax=Algoriphagus jejuensis TaxID=419934 RepID=A0ABN1MVN7_9BACT